MRKPINSIIRKLATIDKPAVKIMYRKTLADMRNDRLKSRADLKVQIDSLKKDGKLAVYLWSRDCDQFESDSVRIIPATVMAYEQWENTRYDWQEGPMVTCPISFEQAERFSPTSRDHRAEQMNY